MRLISEQYLDTPFYGTGSQLCAGLKQYFEFCNNDRSHEALGNIRLEEVYCAFDHLIATAA